MTVLFCDLVDSVAIASRLDPEDFMQILRRYQDCCEQLVAHHGGYMASYIGDGILAYFGYPYASEDDAPNAVACGLNLLSTVLDIDTGFSTTLHARVGIATGLVVVGGPSPEQGRPVGVVGDALNIAARLQSIALPNTAVVSDATHRLIAHLFDFRSLGAVWLKGLPRALDAWEVVESRVVQSRFKARLQDIPTPFVGRDQEMTLLMRAWERACGGHGQVIAITGEPGIGKSRLTDALQQRLADQQHTSRCWFCSPQHKDSPLYVVRAQIEGAASISRRDTPAEKLSKLRSFMGEPGAADDLSFAVFAELLSIAPDAPSPLDAVTPEKRRDITMTALLNRLDRMAAELPTLMIVEDLHWMDATSLDLLDLVVNEVEARHILLVVTLRPGFEPRWAQRDFVTSLSLSRLDWASSIEICRHAAGQRLLPSVLHQIVARSDGVPLFAEELTKTVLEALEDATSQSASPANLPATTPDSLHGSLVTRLDRLGTARKIANIGAVIGRTFPYDLLAKVAGQSDASLRTELKQLVCAGLAVPVGDEPVQAYMFKHALMRDAAYESVLKSERQALHGRIALALQSEFADMAVEEPQLLAYHLVQSGAEQDAIPFWERAGRLAAARASHIEAAGHFTNALHLIRRHVVVEQRPPSELPNLIQLAISLSSALGYAVEDVRTVLTEARNLCEQMNDADGLYPVLRGLCTFSIVSSDLQVAEELARRCLAIGNRTSNPVHLIEGHTPLGYILVARGELNDGRAHLNRALQLHAEQAGTELVFPTEQDPVMACLSLLAIAYLLSNDRAQATEAHHAALARAYRLGRPFDIAYALSFAAKYSNIAGEYEAGKRHAEDAIVLCERYGFGVWLNAARVHRSVAIGYLGDPTEAIRRLEPDLATWAKSGCKFLNTYNLGQLAHFYSVTGRNTDARRQIEEAIETAASCDDLFYLAALHRIRAELAVRDDPAAIDFATAELQTALAVARDQGAIALEQEALAALQRLAHRNTGQVVPAL